MCYGSINEEKNENGSILLNGVVCSAPGKVILFGEHAVVYGKKAIAAALSDLRISVELEPVGSSRIIEIHLEDIESYTGSYFQCNWPIELLTNAFQETDINLFLPKPNLQFVSKIQQFLVLQNYESFQKPLTPLLFLIWGILHPVLRRSTTGFRIRVKSEGLPKASGLGSSGAYSVALAAACLSSKNEINILDDAIISSLSTDQLKLINAWAFASEVLLHGNPSGIDNTVSTYGGAILFQREPYLLKPLLVNRTIDVLLTNTCVDRSTRELVSSVRRLVKGQKGTKIMQCMDSIHEIAEQGSALLKEFSSNDTPGEWNKFTKLIVQNQELLREINVSHKSIDHICQMTAQNNFSTKLTGAGGGGCTISFSNNMQSFEFSTLSMIEDLRNEGFSCFKSAIGGNGIRIHKK